MLEGPDADAILGHLVVADPVAPDEDPVLGCGDLQAPEPGAEVQRQPRVV